MGKAASEFATQKTLVPTRTTSANSDARANFRKSRNVIEWCVYTYVLDRLRPTERLHRASMVAGAQADIGRGYKTRTLADIPLV